MSKNLKYYQTLDALVTHALLALYCTISQQGGLWTTKKEMRCWLKSSNRKLNNLSFRCAKLKSKQYSVLDAVQNGNLERQLWAVNRLNFQYKAKFSQVDELYITLNGLFEQHQFPPMLDNSEKDIEHGFDEDNNQIKPLPMTLESAH